MIGIILAGGFSKRMKKHTEYTPKPMLTIGGKRIVEHIIEKIERLDDISKVYILTNSKFKYLFYEFANNYMAQKSKLQIIIVEEPGTYKEKDKLGSIGGIHHFIKTYSPNDDLLIIGGDNFFTFNLDNLVDMFKEKRSPIVIIKKINNKAYLSNLAVASIRKNMITKFSIKPDKPKTNYAGTMIYIIPKENINEIHELYKNKIIDPTGRLIEHLINRNIAVYASIEKNGFWADIGNEKMYKKIFNFYNKNNANFEEYPKI